MMGGRKDGLVLLKTKLDESKRFWKDIMGVLPCPTSLPCDKADECEEEEEHMIPQHACRVAESRRVRRDRMGVAHRARRDRVCARRGAFARLMASAFLHGWLDGTARYRLLKKHGDDYTAARARAAADAAAEALRRREDEAKQQEAAREETAKQQQAAWDELVRQERQQELERGSQKVTVIKPTTRKPIMMHVMQGKADRERRAAITRAITDRDARANLILQNILSGLESEPTVIRKSQYNTWEI